MYQINRQLAVSRKKNKKIAHIALYKFARTHTHTFFFFLKAMAVAVLRVLWATSTLTCV